MAKVFKILAQRWVLLLVLLIFVCFKIPHLFYPYYWDECWPYAPAIKQMYHHGISLMPNAVDAELSRGHPLFFHAIAAIWMNIFGTSHLAMHCFALSISVLFLIAIYETGYRLFNKRVAIMSILLVATQVIFFVQSSFVLFEMLIAFLVFLSLVFYVKKQYFLTTFCLSALFYTKESGLILGAMLGIDAFLGLFRRNTGFKQRVFQLVSIAIPCLLVMLFFLLQKHIRGWYIFPFYSSIIEHSWNSFWYNFRIGCLRLVFIENFKFVTYLVLIFVTVIATIKSKNYRLLVILFPALIIYYYIDDLRAGRIMPSIPFFILFIISIACFLFTYGSKQFFKLLEQRRLIILSGIFIFCFLCFSTMNFFTYRYLLAALIPMLFLVSVFFDLMIRHSFSWLFYSIVASILIIGFFSFKYNETFGDADLGAFRGMTVHQNVVDYLENQNEYQSVITTGSFLETQHLFNPETGFLHSSKHFTTILYDITPNTKYIILDNIEPDGRYENIKKDSNFTLVFRTEKGNVWAEIYMRK